MDNIRLALYSPLVARPPCTRAMRKTPIQIIFFLEITVQLKRNESVFSEATQQSLEKGSQDCSFVASPLNILVRLTPRG